MCSRRFERDVRFGVDAADWIGPQVQHPLRGKNGNTIYAPAGNVNLFWPLCGTPHRGQYVERATMRRRLLGVWPMAAVVVGESA